LFEFLDGIHDALFLFERVRCGLAATLKHDPEKWDRFSLAPNAKMCLRRDHAQTISYRAMAIRSKAIAPFAARRMFNDPCGGRVTGLWIIGKNNAACRISIPSGNCLSGHDMAIFNDDFIGDLPCDWGVVPKLPPAVVHGWAARHRRVPSGLSFALLSCCHKSNSPQGRTLQ
jgi:hypothetical protein